MSQVIPVAVIKGCTPPGLADSTIPIHTLHACMHQGSGEEGRPYVVPKLRILGGGAVPTPTLSTCSSPAVCLAHGRPTSRPPAPFDAKYLLKPSSSLTGLDKTHVVEGPFEWW